MYVAIGSTKPNFAFLFIFTIILNVGLAFCNSIIDGISVEISNYFKQKSLSENNSGNNALFNEPLLNPQDSQIQNNDTNQSSSNCCKRFFNFGSAASIQSLSYFFRSCGSLGSSAMLIGLNNFDNYAVINLTGIIYLVIVLPFLLLLFPKSQINLQNKVQQEGENKKPVTLMGELMKYWQIITQIWRCLIFVFLLNIPPTITDVFFAFVYCRYDYLTAQQYRVFNFMSLLGAVLGGLAYFLFLSRFCENKKYLIIIFIGTQLLNCAFGFLFVPLSNLSNSFADDGSITGIYGIPFGYAISIIVLLDTFTSSLVLMPQLTLAAQMSPLRLETSVFACFIGISHLGELISAAISSALLTVMNVKEGHWNNLTTYVIICSLSGLLPLFGLILIKRVKTEEIEGEIEGNRNNDSMYFMENELVNSDNSDESDVIKEQDDKYIDNKMSVTLPPDQVNND